MSDWRKRPTLIEHWGKDIDTLMAIDENGTTDLKGIRKKIRENFFVALSEIDKIALPHDRWFTITGVVMNRNEFPAFKDAVNTIKFAYWEEGKFAYKKGLRRVVFHSSEIRKRVGPFNPKGIDYGTLMGDISSMVENTDFKIFSSSIDKVSHVLGYATPFPVYNLCLDFIVERYCRELKKQGQSGALLLESRGKKEDREILEHLVQLLESGNNFWGPDHFECIKGVYFNPKWCFDHQTSYALLELADLVSYPIYKFVSTGNQDQAFDVFKNKIHNYPNYNGYGLKKFPAK